MPYSERLTHTLFFVPFLVFVLASCNQNTRPMPENKAPAKSSAQLTTIDPATAAELERRGHAVVFTEKPLGGCQAILIDRERGALVGGSDPRKDGLASGY